MKLLITSYDDDKPEVLCNLPLPRDTDLARLRIIYNVFDYYGQMQGDYPREAEMHDLLKQLGGAIGDFGWPATYNFKDIHNSEIWLTVEIVKEKP